MYRLSRLVGVLGCAATFALVGCATSGSMTPASGTSGVSQQVLGSNSGWIHDGNITYHAPHYMLSRSASIAQRSHGVIPNILLNYYNGPVLVKPKTYLILWGFKKYKDPDKVAKLLKSYLHLEGGSAHNNIYTQYYMTSGNKKVYITNPKTQWGGVWDDEKDSIPQYPTDYQVAQESLLGVKHFGYDAGGSYIVATAHDHNSSGFGTQWCAYHSSVTSTGNLVSYTNLPYMPDAGSNCGANFISPPKDETGTDEGVTIVEGHEYGESVTDPNPGTGWYNFSYGEIGDICAWTDVQNDPFGSKSYTMQPMFSNATQSCVHSY